MILLLCSERDEASLQFAKNLTYTACPVRVLTAQQLQRATDFYYSHSGSDLVATVDTQDGETIGSHNMSFVINCVRHVSVEYGHDVDPAERLYFEQEMLAAWIAWLSALDCPVINRPTGVSLAGPLYYATAWRLMAERSGLTVMQHSEATKHRELTAEARYASAVVWCGQAFSRVLPKRLLAQCVQLAKIAELEMMEAFFLPNTNDWDFIGAQTVPRLSCAPPELLLTVRKQLLEAGP